MSIILKGLSVSSGICIGKAILINKDQKWLNTQDFLSAIKNNFQIN